MPKVESPVGDVGAKPALDPDAVGNVRGLLSGDAAAPILGDKADPGPSLDTDGGAAIRDEMGSKFYSPALSVGPAAKRVGSFQAAAADDTTDAATYDSNGNLTRLDHADGSHEAWTYDAATGQVTSYTDQEGRVVKQRIDPASGNVTVVVRVVGLDDDASAETDDLVTSYTYTDATDALPAGLLESITDPTGSVTRIDYDDDPSSPDYGRAIALTYAYGTADASTIQFGYDEEGNVNSLTDAVDNATTWELDSEGRVTCESIIINQQTLTRQYVYDENDRLWITIDRNDRAIEYLYNADGLVEYEKWYAEHADPRDVPEPTPVRVIHYTYTHDAAGNLTGFTVDDTDVDLTYTYDSAGYLTDVSWDFAGLAGTDDVTFAYAYLHGDLQTTTATIDGTGDFKNEYAYDAFGRLTQVTQTGVQGGNAVADKRVDFTYNDAGQLETIARYADLDGLDPVAESTYVYNDDLGWLTSLVHTINDTSETICYGYTYEDDGKIDTIDSSEDGLYDYDYDSQDQLTDVSLDTGGGASAIEHYQYDANGNRESSTVGGETKTYTTAAYNRLESVDDGTTVTVFGYDAEGNTVLKFTDVDESGDLTTGDTEITEYEWDHRNRLVSVTDYATFADYHVTSSQTVEYAYDFLNRLISRTLDADGSGVVESPVAEYYVYDGDTLATDYVIAEWAASEDGATPFGPDPNIDLGQIVLQLDDTGAPTHRYLWGPAVDQILADETVDGWLEGTLWLLTDHQNTVRDLVIYHEGHERWQVANHIIYESFGGIVTQTDPGAACSFGPAARYLDAATEIAYHGHRWRTVYYATWLSPDPIGFEGGDANLYRYCANDPGNIVDASGCEGSQKIEFVYPMGYVPGTSGRLGGMYGVPVINDSGADWRILIGILPPERLPPPRIGIHADLRSETERYMANLLYRAQDPNLSIEERGAAVQQYLELKWQLADVGTCERFFTDLFRPRGYQSGIGGTSLFEQALIISLGVARAAPGRTQGASTITPRNVHLAGKNHPVTGIPFDKQGYPDFSAVATHTLKIDRTGSYAGDFRAANRAAGLKNTPEGFTWHHHQDGTTMQLVPRPIHRATGHTGGMVIDGP